MPMFVSLLSCSLYAVLLFESVSCVTGAALRTGAPGRMTVMIALRRPVSGNVDTRTFILFTHLDTCALAECRPNLALAISCTLPTSRHNSTRSLIRQNPGNAHQPRGPPAPSAALQRCAHHQLPNVYTRCACFRNQLCRPRPCLSV